METREERLAVLVAALDSPAHNEAEEARVALQDDYGADALVALVGAAPGFGEFGQVMAAEVFGSIGDARALPAVLGWLTSEDPTVRLFAIQAVESIGSPIAIPALQDAWAASKARGDLPTWIEPSTIRSALWGLGGREVVLPDEIRVLVLDESPFGLAWALVALDQVLVSLASARQVIVSLALWERRSDPRTWHWLGGSTPIRDEQWSEPWAQLVVQSSEQTRRDAKAMKLPRRAQDVEVVVEWMDEQDL